VTFADSEFGGTFRLVDADSEQTVSQGQTEVFYPFVNLGHPERSLGAARHLAGNDCVFRNHQVRKVVGERDPQ
jgi:hypothetical protein